MSKLYLNITASGDHRTPSNIAKITNNGEIRSGLTASTAQVAKDNHTQFPLFHLRYCTVLVIVPTMVKMSQSLMRFQGM